MPREKSSPKPAASLTAIQTTTQATTAKPRKAAAKALGSKDTDTGTDALSRAMVAGLDKALIDHRIYTIQPRRMQAFLDAFEQLALPVLVRTLGHPLGFWVSHVGPQNQFVHLWGYDSLADYEARCARRDADPDLPAYFQATRDLIVAQETRLIRRVKLGVKG